MVRDTVKKEADLREEERELDRRIDLINVIFGRKDRCSGRIISQLAVALNCDSEIFTFSIGVNWNA